jgi:hypothetical protein
MHEQAEMVRTKVEDAEGGSERLELQNQLRALEAAIVQINMAVDQLRSEADRLGGLSENLEAEADEWVDRAEQHEKSADELAEED